MNKQEFPSFQPRLTLEEFEVILKDHIPPAFTTSFHELMKYTENEARILRSLTYLGVRATRMYVSHVQSFTSRDIREQNLAVQTSSYAAGQKSMTTGDPELDAWILSLNLSFDPNFSQSKSEIHYKQSRAMMKNFASVAAEKGGAYAVIWENYLSTHPRLRLED